MGRIKIEAYGKIIYDKVLPDAVCFAVAKERENRDRDYAYKKRNEEPKEGKPLQDPKDLEAF